MAAGPRPLTLDELRQETIAKRIPCPSIHARVPGLTCDLTIGHAGEHERCLRDGTIMAWRDHKPDDDVKQFEWAAGINSYPYKRRGQLRNLTSDHQVKPCVEDEESAALKARKLEDQRRGILSVID